jgi:branched-chain amino acid transport system permease protein
MKVHPLILAALMAALLAIVGFGQSWPVALEIIQLSLISAIMALGLNVQWGYAGLVNVGLMGFAALGGAGAVLMTMPPYAPAWAAGGRGILVSGLILVLAIGLIGWLRQTLQGRWRSLAILALVVAAYVLIRRVYDPAVTAIEAADPAKFGYLGGLGMPVAAGWVMGGLLAAAAAWGIGKITLGLRSDYLAIATLGISEIIVAVMKNEDWLTRGVKNVTGLPQPVTAQIDLQAQAWVISWADRLGVTPAEFASIWSKLMYCLIFAAVLGVLLWFSQRALYSPWGRMMRAIRDNRDAAEAMGKNVPARHLQVFIIGSAICGLAGAMLITRDGQLTTGSFSPLRYTFTIWVMVIVGGSGNNWGSVLGAFLIWFIWIEAEPAGMWLMDAITAGMDDGSAVRKHLLESAPHLRLILMGTILLSVLRFAPRGLIPER